MLRGRSYRKAPSAGFDSFRRRSCHTRTQESSFVNLIQPAAVRFPYPTGFESIIDSSTLPSHRPRRVRRHPYDPKHHIANAEIKPTRNSSSEASQREKTSIHAKPRKVYYTLSAPPQTFCSESAKVDRRRSGNEMARYVSMGSKHERLGNIQDLVQESRGGLDGSWMEIYVYKLHRLLHFT